MWQYKLSCLEMTENPEMGSFMLHCHGKEYDDIIILF